MALSINVTESQVLTKLVSLIAGIVPGGTPVIQGLGNLVPPPAGAYVMLTPLFHQRLATNTDTPNDSYPVAGTMAMSQHIRLDVQVDFFGPIAADWAAMFTTAFRDQYACDALAPVCQPLYADEGRRMPYVTGEQQYQTRWTTTAAVQYNPVTTTSQQFADAAEVTVVEVDAAYPPA